MSQASVEFDTKDWDLFISGLSKNVGRARDILREAAKIFVFQDIIQHFKDESGPDGKWKDWAESTKLIYKFLGYSGNKKLQLTGNLRQSIVPSNIKDEGRDAVKVFSSNRTYSARHNYGHGSTPQREFMWISDSAHEKMAKAMLQMVLEERV